MPACRTNASAWLLATGTVTDTAISATNGMREHLFGASNEVTRPIQSFYVHLLMMSLGLLGWQLYSRGAEPLARLA